jgi:hypothetical protein
MEPIEKIVEKIRKCLRLAGAAAPLRLASC